MTITAGIPSRAAWYATAWAWLPALMAITPRRRSSADSDRSLLSAPRSLNDAVNWRFSNLRKTCAPVSRDSVRLSTHGVCSTALAMRPAAARTSSIDTASRETTQHYRFMIGALMQSDARMLEKGELTLAPADE